VIASVIAGAAILFVIGVLTHRQGGPSEQGSAGVPASGALTPPSDIKASSRPFEITLSWGVGDPGANITHFLVYRDDALIQTVQSGIQSYRDHDILPGLSYRYEVRAIDDAGRLSPPASLGVTAPTPPLENARLDGVFDTGLTKTSSFGVKGFRRHEDAGWRFSPTCPAGACHTVWRDLHLHSLRDTLERTGPRYRGSVVVHGYIGCSGTPVSSTLALRIRVVRAGAVHGEWRATSIAGTLHVATSAQLGCRSSGLSFRVRGDLVTGQGGSPTQS
jgi:hypothetical protein